MTSADQSTSYTSTSILSYASCLKYHTPCYCEENVWHILRHANAQGHRAESLYAIFITNANRCVPFRHQKAQQHNTDTFIYWDYHVIALIHNPTTKSAYIYDIDSTLPFPCSMITYLDETFGRNFQNGILFRGIVKDGFGPQFRIVAFEDLLKSFSSDRRHMKVDGQQNMYRSPPPHTQCIRASTHQLKHTLPSFLVVDGLPDDDLFATGIEQDFHAPGRSCTSVDELLEYIASRNSSNI